MLIDPWRWPWRWFIKIVPKLGEEVLDVKTGKTYRFPKQNEQHSHPPTPGEGSGFGHEDND